MSKNNSNSDPKITDFFGSKLENKNNPNVNRGEYRPMNPNYKASNPVQQNSRQPPQKPPSNFTLRDFESFKDSSKTSAQVDLDDCWTYALPCHIPKVWRTVKPLLSDIRDKKVLETETFIELIRKIIQCHYSAPRKDLHLKNLHTLIDGLKSEDTVFFYDKLLPFMGKLALEVETLFREPLCILKQNYPGQVTLNKRQVACLVLQMFFCTLHTQNNTKLRADCNFTKLYKAGGPEKTKVEKLKCIYNYIRRIYRANVDDRLTYENLTYERLCLSVKIHGYVTIEFWLTSQMSMRKCNIKYKGTIEDEKKAIQVDFANRELGGGVLNTGCVQEEIRFTVSPELLVSMLIAENLSDSEALMMIGSEIYCKHTGYRDSFKFGEDHIEKIGKDGFNRKDSMVLAIDAVDFSKVMTKNVQFKKERMLRELNKAYIGFTGSKMEDGPKKVIATGKWGCGAFRGDTQLKMVLQWLAASQAGRDMIFYSFDDDRSLDNMEKVVKNFQEMKVGELFQKLLDYHTFLFEQKGNMLLFDFLLDVE